MNLFASFDLALEAELQITKFLFSIGFNLDLFIQINQDFDYCRNINKKYFATFQN